MPESHKCECVGVSRWTPEATEGQQSGMPYFNFYATRAASSAVKHFLFYFFFFCCLTVQKALSYQHTTGKKINNLGCQGHSPYV